MSTMRGDLIFYVILLDSLIERRVEQIASVELKCKRSKLATERNTEKNFVVLFAPLILFENNNGLH